MVHFILVGAMMRDEASAVVATFAPWVAAGFRHFFLYDTGSTDGTIETLRAYLPADCELHVVEEPFVDFGVSRTRMLRLASQTSARWLMMLDAEFVIHGAAQLPAALETLEQQHPDCDAVQVRQTRHDGMQFYLPLLTRLSAAQLRYRMSVHEFLDGARHMATLSDDIWIHKQPSAHDARKSLARWFRDLGWLHRECREAPDDTIYTRALFYLARTYHQLNELECARIFFERCASHERASPQERYCALLTLAELAPDLPARRTYLWRAVPIDSQRAEAYTLLAASYDDALELKGLCADLAISVGAPRPDKLFARPLDYDYERYFQFGWAQYYRATSDAERLEGFHAALRAAIFAEEHPDHFVHSNAVYQSLENAKQYVYVMGDRADMRSLMQSFHGPIPRVLNAMLDTMTNAASKRRRID